MKASGLKPRAENPIFIGMILARFIAFTLALAAAFGCDNAVSVRGITRKASPKAGAAVPTTIVGKIALAGSNGEAPDLTGGTVVVASRPDVKATTDASGAFNLVVTAPPPTTTDPAKPTVAVGAFGLSDQSVSI